MATASSTATPVIKNGVAPLRAGQGTSFLLRRLHSLSGIVPVGLFLIEHFVSNAFATRGPDAYGKQVELLSSFPFVFYLELFGIWLPIAYHAGYGFYIWYRGEGNLGDYPWTGNWMYTAQRWTGGIAFLYIVWHTYTMRFNGTHLLSHPYLAFGKVQNEVFVTWAFLFYVVGVICASWHFAYGLWLFAAKWGITQGEQARRRFGYVCLAIALLFVTVGFATLYSFRSTPPQPFQPGATGMDTYTMK